MTGSLEQWRRDVAAVSAKNTPTSMVTLSGVIRDAKKLAAERGLSLTAALREIADPGSSQPKTSNDLGRRSQHVLAEKGIHPGQRGYMRKFREQAETIRNAYLAERINAGEPDRSVKPRYMDGERTIDRMSELQLREGLDPVSALKRARMETSER